MQVAVEKAEGIVRDLLVTIDAKVADEAFESKLKETARQIRLDGFRPGKVPLKVVKQRFGKHIRQEIVQDLIEKNLQKAIEKESLKVAGVNKIDVDQNEIGKDFVFKASVEVFPEVAIKDLDKISVEKVTASVEEADVNDMLANLQKQQAQWEAVDQPSQEGNKVKIDFVGTIDGEKFEGGTADNFELSLGAGEMIEGFESGLVGKKAGETCTLDLTFPENYGKQELAGKPVKFEVTVKEVQRAQLPELNDEFAAKFNVDSIEKLTQEIKNNMERELEFNLKNKVKTQVFDGLLTNNSIDAPSALVQQELQAVKYQTAQQFGMTQNDMWKNLPDDLFKERAEKQVKLALLVNAFIEQNAIKAEDERVTETVKKIASVYEDAEAAEKEILADHKRMEEIKQTVIEDLAVEKILETAKVTETATDFKTAMSPAPNKQAESEKADTSEE